MGTQQTIQSIRGMNDWDVSTSDRLHHIEQQAQSIFAQAGYQKIRLPVLEKTELFARAVGNHTDVVEKEMYSFSDRNDQSLSLRPEGTAGLVRAIIENGWWQQGQLLRYQYTGPMFRRERPQKGRYRQFAQFGAEVFGASNPIIDSEIIHLSYQWLEALGLKNHIQLHINTIGESADRQQYRQALIDYLNPRYDELDEDSQRRLHTNPLRILDSKIEHTQQLLQQAPQLQDFINEKSQTHFTQVLQHLDTLNIDYHLNPQLVRGLDYYNDTVFEWMSDKTGSQNTLCGGGRYDSLMAELGGKNCSAVGFAAGLERMDAFYQKFIQQTLEHHDSIYVICQASSLSSAALFVATQARKILPSIRVVCDVQLGSLKSQFKRADKSGAKIALILAQEEYAKHILILKTLRDTATQKNLLLTDMDTVLPTYFNSA